MRIVRQGSVLVGLLMAVLLVVPVSAQVALTTVADTIYNASGAAAQGSVVVSWSAFTTAAGNSVAAGTTAATLGANGGISIALAPNAGATPTGSYYTAIFHLSDGTTSRQYWVVPASSAPVKLASIQNSVLPTSMAMQTVSKAYVDQAIAAAVTTGTTATGGATTPAYVQKSGDSMTGPLVLPGDPVSALQAADKHYVDANIAALSGGSATKVSTLPSASQTVVQPTGTQLEVNAFNGVLDATGFLSGTGNNGIGGALSNCTGACEISVSQSYPGTELPPLSGLPTDTHLVDHRGGADIEVFQDPWAVVGTSAFSESLIQNTTRTAQQSFAIRPSSGANTGVLDLTHNAMTGGSNQYPGDVEAVPYSKSNYGVLTMSGNYNTQGQHVQMGTEVNCYAVGDCLAGGQFIRSSGGARDEADEGTHPFDLQVEEDSRVFQGTCGSGCTTGSTSVYVNVTANAGTQGDGRFLMDTAPSKTITAGTIAGASGDYLPIVTFTGTNFPVSVQIMTAAAATSQAGNLAPGTVSLPIKTSGLASVYATSTAALPATSGVACVTDQGVFPNFETAKYTVVDGTHVQLTLNKVHQSGAVVAVGGLCGYGLEQKVDTQSPAGQPIRQIFPVAGSPSPTQVYYASASTYIVGVNGGSSTGGFLSSSTPVASATRSGNVVTLNLAQGLANDINGLTMTVSGMADASYNGSFQISTASSTVVTYTANGPDGSSSGGTLSFSNGSYALYPMAEVLSVYNPAASGIDGTFTLAANTVPWAAGDPVEEPHYFQQAVYADTEIISQFVPRPVQYMWAGKYYSGVVGPGARGWAVVNEVPASSYVGAGGTHQVPDAALITVGPWKNAIEVDAGKESVLRIHCNLNTCNRWDSGYSLFAMDRNGGVEDFLNYLPQSDTAQWILGGSYYTFSPTAFTADNIQSKNVSMTSLSTTSLKAGFNGNAQIVSGGSAGYSNFTLNGNNNDGARLGFIGGGGSDTNLYLDVPTGGAFMFRVGSTSVSSSLSASGLTTPGLTAPKLASGNGANTDLVGTLQVAAGSTTSVVYGFAGSYGSAPVCMVQPQNATPAAVQALNGYVAQVSNSTLSVSVGSAPSGTVVFGYTCVARN